MLPGRLEEQEGPGGIGVTHAEPRNGGVALRASSAPPSLDAADPLTPS